MDSFTQSGGNFGGTGAITTGTLTQTGGTLSAGGNLTVTSGFSQGTTGSIGVTGITSITDTSGGVQLGHLSSTGSMSVTSTDGAITQATGTAITASVSSSFAASTGISPVVPANITLTNSGNDFGGAVSLNGAQVSIVDKNSLLLGDVTASGKLDATASNNLTLSGNVSADSLDLTVTTGDIQQTGGSVNVTTGPTKLTAGGDITLDGPYNDFTGTVNAGGDNITLKDVNGITLGNVSAGKDFKVTAGGDITQDNTGGKKILVGGSTDLTAGGDITLDGPNNDFKGTVNAGGDNITLTDENDITLGDMAAAEDFKVTAGGDITQDNTASNKIVVAGNTDLTAGGRVVLDGKNNQLTKGVTVKATSYVVMGDKRKSASDAESKVLGAIAMASMPGVAMPNAQAPQPLVLSSASSGGSASGSAVAGSTTGTNSSGVMVDLQNVSQQNTPLMVAVSLPKGATTVGTGFSFEMPESVKGTTGSDTEVRVTQANGSALPSWLKFDRQALRFEAVSVPDNGLPLQLLVTVAGQRVLVVISERTE